MIQIILYALLAANLVLSVVLTFVAKDHGRTIEELRKECENNRDMIVNMSKIVSDLSDRVDGLEDYVKMIRSETENDKHSDYWASVMNYNPFIEKEGEK